MNYKHLIRIGLLITFAVCISMYGCSSYEKAIPSAEDEGEVSETPNEQEMQEQRENLKELLASNRSRLSDVYAHHHNDIPDAFLKQDTVKKEPPNDPFEGFRIQVLSTREIARADTVSKEFRIWADTTMALYQPKVYVQFKQPFYKVHVGDFQERERAIKLSELIKKKYPDAWVVHDRINPALVPHDSIRIDSLTISREDIQKN